MILTPFIMDGGNSDIKTNAPTGATREDKFPHQLAMLTESAYRRETARAGVNPDEYFVVNGQPYVIGKKALRQGFELQHGARRYNQEYYGVFAAIAMTRAFCKSKRNVFFVGTHAPGDVDYGGDLMTSVANTWNVEWRGKMHTIEVVDATTLDEPLSGYYSYALRKDGKGYAHKDVSKGVSLVIDAGAYTTDIVVIDPEGDIDYSTAQSRRIGVLSAVEKFEADFRSDNRLLLKNTPDFDRRKSHDAFRSGVFDLRGLGQHSCEDQAAPLRTELAMDILNFYATYGGDGNFDTIILTGGGCALLENELRYRMTHNNIVLAGDTASLEMANVRGASKWYRMHDELGTFDEP